MGLTDDSRGRQVSATEDAREGMQAFLQAEEGAQVPGGSQSHAPTWACPIDESAETGACR